MNSILVKNIKKRTKFFFYPIDTRNKNNERPNLLINLSTGVYEPVKKGSIVLTISSTLFDEYIGTDVERLIFLFLSQFLNEMLMSESSIDEISKKTEKFAQKLVNDEEIMKLLTSKKPSDKLLIKKFISCCK